MSKTILKTLHETATGLTEAGAMDVATLREFDVMDDVRQSQIKTADIVYRDDLYPRIKHDPATVQKYAEDLDVLPPIEINQHNELIDGKHRWIAYKKNEVEMIRVVVTKTKSDAHFLELAIERNSTHGLQLNQVDKKRMARHIYHVTSTKDRASKKLYLAKILSVSERTIRSWLARIDKDAKAERNRKIFDLWMQCYTQQEIADVVGTDKQRVSDVICPDLEALPKTDKSAAEHATDFTMPIYNVWRRQCKTDANEHFGNTEPTWLDNLLYLYTEPFDIVVDPFAGGGSTIDVCKKRFRRYFISDRKPIIEREEEIRKHDVTDGLPKLPRWKDVSLVYLDPPYWKQAEGQYSSDSKDLANMSLDDFNHQLSSLIKGFAQKLSAGSYIALIIQPTQWKSDGRVFIDHIGDMLRAVNLTVNMRYSVPYESQQCNAGMVQWAKENKKCLVLTREIIVWEVL